MRLCVVEEQKWDEALNVLIALKKNDSPGKVQSAFSQERSLTQILLVLGPQPCCSLLMDTPDFTEIR